MLAPFPRGCPALSSAFQRPMKPRVSPRLQGQVRIQWQGNRQNAKTVGEGDWTKFTSVLGSLSWHEICHYGCQDRRKVGGYKSADLNLTVGKAGLACNRPSPRSSSTPTIGRPVTRHQGLDVHARGWPGLVLALLLCPPLGVPSCL